MTCKFKFAIYILVRKYFLVSSFKVPHATKYEHVILQTVNAQTMVHEKREKVNYNPVLNLHMLRTKLNRVCRDPDAKLIVTRLYIVSENLQKSSSTVQHGLASSEEVRRCTCTCICIYVSGPRFNGRCFR